MPPTKAQIYQVLFDWLRAETGLVVVQVPQPDGNAPRPARPYVSLKFLNPTDRLGDSIDQQSMTKTIYPATGAIYRVTLGSVSDGCSLSIFGDTFTLGASGDDVRSAFRKYLDHFQANSALVVTQVGTTFAFDVYRASGMAFATPTVSGGWTQGASPLAGTTTYTVATEGMRKAIASINIFGENALDTLAKVRDSLDRPDVSENFALAGISHLDETQVNDLTALQETLYEERAQMDLTVTFVAGSEVDVGTIESVRIEGTINGRHIETDVN